MNAHSDGTVERMDVQTWYEEDIETWLDAQGLVYVFRWVPEFAMTDGHRRSVHPGFDEWLEDMRGAATGLDGPMAAHREYYETTRYGVSGHRPMTDQERSERRAALQRQIDQAQAALREHEGRST